MSAWGTGPELGRILGRLLLGLLAFSELREKLVTSKQRVAFWGVFFWDYSVDSYSGIRITEHSEYQFRKEQTLCYSENRVADVTRN